MVVITLAFSKTVELIGLPPEMSKRPVGLSHFVRVIPLFDRAPLSEGGIFDFCCEVIHHRSPAIFCKSHDPSHRQRDLAFLRDFNHTVVMQDVDALNLLQRTLGSERSGYQELSINIDTGGLAARRMLARLVAAPTAAAPTAAALTAAAPASAG